MFIFRPCVLITKWQRIAAHITDTQMNVYVAHTQNMVSVMYLCLNSSFLECHSSDT